jgi:hypothetical protein
MKQQEYFVSYRLIPSIRRDRSYWQHTVFLTNDIESILIGIIPTRRRTGRGRIKAQLQEYRERGRVTFGRGDRVGMIKDIAIQELPESDEKVLNKYLWARAH